MTTSLSTSLPRWPLQLNKWIKLQSCHLRMAYRCRKLSNTTRWQSSQNTGMLWVRTADNYLHKRTPVALYQYYQGSEYLIRIMSVTNPAYVAGKKSKPPIKATMDTFELRGLVHPYRMSPDESIPRVPHGYRLEPGSSYFYKNFSRPPLATEEAPLEGGVGSVVILPVGTPIPDGLELVQENLYRYYLQCDHAMPGDKFKELGENFLVEKGTILSKEEFLKKYPPPEDN